MPNVLTVLASPRGEASNSRALAAELADKVAQGGRVVERDLMDSELPIVTDLLINAYFSPAEKHGEDHKQAIQPSNTYVKELQDADIVIVATPMYNFTVPGNLKKWIDLVARAGVTFKYSEQGPVGLLQGKKAYFVLTTGGTPLGSDYDYLSPYLKLFFGFIGITDSEVIGATGLSGNEEAGLEQAREEIAAV